MNGTTTEQRINTIEVGTTKVSYTIPIEQDDWVKQKARELREKPAFVIRELIRQAMGMGIAANGFFSEQA